MKNWTTQNKWYHSIQIYQPSVFRALHSSSRHFILTGSLVSGAEVDSLRAISGFSSPSSFSGDPPFALLEDCSFFFSNVKKTHSKEVRAFPYKLSVVWKCCTNLFVCLCLALHCFSYITVIRGSCEVSVSIKPCFQAAGYFSTWKRDWGHLLPQRIWLAEAQIHNICNVYSCNT